MVLDKHFPRRIAEGVTSLLTLTQGHAQTKCRSRTLLQLSRGGLCKELWVVCVDATESIHWSPDIPSRLICALLMAVLSSLVPWWLAQGLNTVILTAVPSDNSQGQEML